MKSFSYKGPLFLAAIRGLVIFLATGISVSYCTPLKFNKVSLFSVDVRTICLIGETHYIVCCLFILHEYFLLLVPL